MKLLLLALLPSALFAGTAECLQKINAPVKFLSQTCLYRDINSRQINAEIVPFVPRHVLWTDGATKKRWIYIPKGSRIDNRDRNNWIFPVGTTVWKEFNKGRLTVETRFFRKIKPGRGFDKWIYATYQWTNDQMDAIYLSGGADNVLGTNHQIPSIRQCVACHRGSADSLLGFSAFQLNRNTIKKAWNLSKLDYFKRLKYKAKIQIRPLADPLTEQAVGYLHANCSHCHGQNHAVGRNTGLQMHYDLYANKLNDLPVFKTAVGKDTTFYNGAPKRIQPGNIHDSAVHMRLNSNVRGTMMAPIGRKTIDPYGTKIIESWIKSMK